MNNDKKLRRGDRIKDYCITCFNPIYIGNLAVSYKAVDQAGREILLKQYKKPNCQSKGFDKFVEQQRELMKLFRGKDFVEEILEVFEIDGVHWQAKEFMRGTDLRKYLKKKLFMKHNERKFISLGILGGLKKVHNLGIIHCDLKPSQIFLQENNESEMKYSIKFTDFDFSRIPDKYEPIYAVGTPGYTCPECIRGETVDFESDIFSAGIILFNVLIGSNDPYQLSENESYDDAALNYRINKIRKVLDNNLVPGELSTLLIQMLDPDKNNRPSLEKAISAVNRCA